MDQLMQGFLPLPHLKQSFQFGLKETVAMALLLEALLLHLVLLCKYYLWIKNKTTVDRSSDSVLKLGNRFEQRYNFYGSYKQYNAFSVKSDKNT